MTASQVWTLRCDGRGADVGCGSWIGQESTEEAARSVARAHGWQVGQGKARHDLCPRHRAVKGGKR